MELRQLTAFLVAGLVIILAIVAFSPVPSAKAQVHMNTVVEMCMHGTVYYSGPGFFVLAVNGNGTPRACK